MDISIIIVSWNTRDLTLQCIESIYRCTTRAMSIEIIVVDNGSSDDSCSAIRKQYKDVILIENKENFGFARANNIGIRQAKGAYLALVNSDVKFLEDSLGVLFDYMGKDRSIGIAAPKVLNGDLTYQYSCRRLPTLANNLIDALGISFLLNYRSNLGSEFLNLDGERDPLPVGILSGCFWFIRKEAIDEVGELDERFFFYGEDKDLCIRFHQKKWKVMYYPMTQVVHYGGASSSRIPVKYYIELQKAQLYFWKKHYPPFVARLFVYCRMLFFITRIVPGYFYAAFRKDYVSKLNMREKAFRWLRKNMDVCNDHRI